MITSTWVVGFVATHCEDGPKQEALGPFGMTISARNKAFHMVKLGHETMNCKILEHTLDFDMH